MFSVQCSMFPLSSMNDLKFAFRQLLKNPGFAAVAVLTLALGIGANTAMFSVVNAILLRPLPFTDPERLVMVFERGLRGSHKGWVSAPLLGEWREQTTVFEGLAARGFGGFILTGKGQPENITGSRLSANIFSLLGIKPMLGRDFLPEDPTGFMIGASTSTATWPLGQIITGCPERAGSRSRSWSTVSGSKSIRPANAWSSTRCRQKASKINSSAPRDSRHLRTTRTIANIPPRRRKNTCAHWLRPPAPTWILLCRPKASNATS